MVDYWMFKVHGNDKLEDALFGGPILTFEIFIAWVRRRHPVRGAGIYYPGGTVLKC
jgi:hypothetical protein